MPFELVIACTGLAAGVATDLGQREPLACGVGACWWSERAGRGKPVRFEVEPAEFDEHVVAAVVVQDASTVYVRARSDQEIRRGRAAMVSSAREVARRVESSIFDVCVDPKARQLQ